MLRALFCKSGSHYVFLTGQDLTMKTRLGYVCARVSVCLCVCVGHVYAGAHTHVCMCGGQRSMLSILPYCFPSSFLKQGLSVNLVLTTS